QREDRGSAIVSSEPLQHTLAIELPFERQRRVALGASLRVRTDAGTRDLQVLNVHLEPLSSPGSLWLFKNPRKRQIGTVLAWLNGDQRSTRRLMAGVVLGGDLNTIQGGDQEPAYARVRRWSHSLATEDVRPTHRLGRLDYLFARLAPGWQATTTRVDARYGSDHHPVLARFQRGSAPPDGFQGRTAAP